MGDAECGGTPPESNINSVTLKEADGSDPVLDAMPPGQDFSAHPARAFENLDQDEGTLEERRARVRKEAVVGEGGA